MARPTLDPVVDAFQAAGFADVRISRLDVVERRERLVNPGASSTDRYAIVAITSPS